MEATVMINPNNTCKGLGIVSNILIILMLAVTVATDNITKADIYHLAKLNSELRKIEKRSLKIKRV